MRLDASSLLGSPQLSGVRVNPRGTGKKISADSSFGTAAVTRGLWINRANREREQAAVSTAPAFDFVALLAVTAEEVALVKIDRKKSGALEPELKEALARAARGDVAGAELGRARITAPALTISFANGEVWIFECSPLFRKNAKRVVQTLTGSR